MCSVTRTALAITVFIAVIGIPHVLYAETLTPEQIRLLNEIKSNPLLIQQADALLHPGTSSRRLLKAKTKQPGSPTKEAVSNSPKEPDTITQLIQANANNVPSERQYSP